MLNDRLQLVLKEQKLSQTDLGRALGVNPSAINPYVRGRRTDLPLRLAKQIETLYGYSAEWLMTGEGEKRKADPLLEDKQALIAKIDKMDDCEIFALLAFANAMDTIKAAKREERGAAGPKKA